MLVASQAARVGTTSSRNTCRHSSEDLGRGREALGTSQYADVSRHGRADHRPLSCREQCHTDTVWLIGRDLLGQFPCQIATHPGAGNHAFRQAVARQPIRSVHPGASHLTDGVEPSQLGATIEIGAYPATDVVGSGRNGDAVSRRIDTRLPAGCSDRGESLVEPRHPCAWRRDRRDHRRQLVPQPFGD